MSANTDALLAVMTRLRDPQSGCPWDIEQTFATIAPYTIEEAYEVAEAIQTGDMAALKDELGDLLLQVVYHAEMAREAGAFDYEDLAGGVVAKMTKRHPHVFGEASVADAAAQTAAWETHKERERSEKARRAGQVPSALDGVALGLPALLRALKLQKRAARVGFDWSEIEPVLDKLMEEIDELKAALAAGAERERVTDELGDILFACVNLARHASVDAEGALRAANAKFERRFRRIEENLAQAGRRPEQAGLAELERLWNQAKAEED